MSDAISSYKNKILVIILDGLGDRLTEGYTPLEKAHKPNLDYLAHKGILGIMDPIAPGVIPGSDTAHLALLGYDPYKYYTGRGPFEAIGIGMEVKGGDIAFRCNFSTVSPDWLILDRRAGRIREGTRELAQAVNGMEIQGVRVFFQESVEHRGALVLRGEGLSSLVEDIDPHLEGVKVKNSKPLKDIPSEMQESALKTSEVLNEFVKRSYEILSHHPINREREALGEKPANIILPRGAGVVPHLPTFFDKYGLKGAFIAEVGLVKGIARTLGLYTPDYDFTTGSYDTDMKKIIEEGLKLLSEYDVVFINIKGCDVAAHDRSFSMKVKTIEKFDEAIANLKDFPGTLVVTSDHSSPISKGDHSGDPVPLLITGDVRVDSAKFFTERDAAYGGLGRIRGIDLIPILLDLAGFSHKFGA